MKKILVTTMMPNGGVSTQLIKFALYGRAQRAFRILVNTGEPDEVLDRVQAAQRPMSPDGECQRLIEKLYRIR